jgi:hypothetical protein
MSISKISVDATVAPSTLPPPSKKPAAPKIPKSKPSVTAPLPPTTSAVVPTLPSTSTKKGGRSLPAAAVATGDPVAVVNAPPAKTRRTLATPISPRTVNVRLSARGEEALSYRDVRATTDALAKNISRALTLAYTIGKKGSVTHNGRVHTRTDLREMSRTLTKSVRQVPTACRQSSHRTPAVMADEERETRVVALLNESSAGVDALAAAIKVPRLSVPLRASEEARIRENKNPPKLGAGAQIGAPFYISDPLRRFIQNADLGNGIANLFPGMPESVRCVSGARHPEDAIKAVASHIGTDPLKELGITFEQAKILADPRRVLSPLVIEKGIATSPILMSVMAAYIVANGLKDPETGRIIIDGHMKKYLGDPSTTRWVFEGKDYTPEDAAESVNTSGIARLVARPPKKEGDPLPCDGTSFTRSMSITIASMYRIARPPAAEALALKDDHILRLANGIKAYL